MGDLTGMLSLHLVNRGVCVLSGETTNLLRPVRCLTYSCKQVSVSIASASSSGSHTQ